MKANAINCSNSFSLKPVEILSTSLNLTYGVKSSGEIRIKQVVRFKKYRKSPPFDVFNFMSNKTKKKKKRLPMLEYPLWTVELDGFSSYSLNERVFPA